MLQKKPLIIAKLDLLATKTLERNIANSCAEYLALNHMKQVTTNLEAPHFYLPHHGVVRETSSTTRLRVVFNGSQKTSSGVSLNDCLHTGPKIQNELVDVLLRWRRHPIVFACDIENMYRQILVHENDQPFQRIIWRENPIDDLKSYELTTVTYGLSCAPYMAIRCIRQLYIEKADSQPRGADALQNDTYVDDILSGANDLNQVQELIFELNNVLTSGCFKARKWISNLPEALCSLHSDLLATSDTLNIESTDTPRALGLLWNNKTDEFVFRLNIDYADSKITKRSVLSFIAKLFDPLGWLSPFIITAKILMQHLWTRNLDWDDLLTDDLAENWKSFINSFRETPVIRVPRWLGVDGGSESVEVHGFADASVSAFGAVVYLRVLNRERVRVTLLLSKTKVAPLKSITIPGLELCAAVLLVRLVKKVLTVLALHHLPVHLWTDSTIALSWICSHPSKWKDFVRNRVVQIQDLAQATWHHVPGHDNPADFASRGMNIQLLQRETTWWSGPSWLSAHPSQWPLLRPSPSTDVNRELRLKPTSHATTQSGNDWDLKYRFSSLNKLLRVTAWCRRIFNRSKFDFFPYILSPSEIKNALMFWVRECQLSAFGNELTTIKEGRSLHRSSPLFRLVPFIDGDGFLRVTGRLRFSNLDFDEKHPIILPRDSRLTTLIIDCHHRLTLHGGTQLTLSSLRRQFWIIGGRVPVRKFIHQCMICAKQRAETTRQLMGQLPSPRITPSRPFLHTGVDYAGPFFLRTIRGRSVSSAIHLEVATDYSTSGFIAAYKRFTGRRGICNCLYSDCGSNLVGADRELRSLFSAASGEFRRMANLLIGDGTSWKFNSPASPHFGGKWEAGIKSVKTHLRKVVGSSLLTYEEFSTVLIQIEAVLNSRPLSAMSDDPNSYEVLTPAHFLIGEALTVVPEPSILTENINRLNRWQLLRRMVEDFWTKW
ncbi:uncharacterized protein [Onthophagus taurus]|uniref:uncharacterized protein n=1 Tax=Onthophagus taurus TaxID=166361 RepID=UPI0039BE2E99